MLLVYKISCLRKLLIFSFAFLTLISCQSPDERIEKAIQSFEKGKNQEALQHLEKALQLSPYHARALNLKGVVLFELEEYENSITAYTKSIASDSGEYKAFYNRANAYYQIGSFDEAVDDYTRAIRLKPSIADIYLNRGNTFYQINRFSDAVADYEFAQKLDADNPVITFNLARAYFLMDEVEKADVFFDRTIQLDMENAAAHYFLGMSKIWSGYDKQGCSLLEKALHLGYDEAAVSIERYCK